MILLKEVPPSTSRLQLPEDETPSTVVLFTAV